MEEIGKYFELENYTPHLTLGQTHFGMISEELQEMAQKAESELTPNPAFEASYVRVYQEIEADRYVKYKDIQLKK